MKTLETQRLILRSFQIEDLGDLHRVLDLDLRWDEEPLTLEERRRLLQDDIKNAELNPPFGRWAIVLKSSSDLIGIFLIRTGWLDATIRRLFVPPEKDSAGPYSTLEVYIGYGLASAHRGQGYAAEAGKAVVDYAFREVGVWRIVAHTSHANERSASVMRRIGMQTVRNPHSNWPGVIGMIHNGGIV